MFMYFDVKIFVHVMEILLKYGHYFDKIIFWAVIYRINISRCSTLCYQGFIFQKIYVGL